MSEDKYWEDVVEKLEVVRDPQQEFIHSEKLKDEKERS